MIFVRHYFVIINICEYLGESFSDFPYEIATTIVIYQVFSKSFAYVATIIIVSVAIFIIVIDVLKYYFDIDPIRQRLTQIRSTQRAKQKESIHR